LTQRRHTPLTYAQAVREELNLFVLKSKLYLDPNIYRRLNLANRNQGYINPILVLKLLVSINTGIHTTLTNTVY